MLNVLMTMAAHDTVNLTHAFNYEVGPVCSVLHLPLFAKLLFLLLLFYWLEYFNSLLSGCPWYLLNRLQKVWNDVDRLILKTPRTNHTALHLHTLHWLPVNARIKHTISSVCFCAITPTGPVYHSDMLKIYTPSRQLWYSADSLMLCIPSVSTKLCCEYSYIAPAFWKVLPKDISFSQSVLQISTQNSHGTV